MHSDSFFYIGKTHNVCQDYARHGEFNGQPYAIVSDGCSGSPDTDIGSRLITLAAAHEITALPLSMNVGPEDSFGSFTIGHAIGMLRDTLGLTPNCLDATLLAAIATDEYTYINVIGDGVVALIDNNNIITVTEVIYPSGAPRYLTYWRDADRFNGYKEHFGLEGQTKIYSLGNPAGPIDNDFEDLKIKSFKVPNKDFKTVVLMSDGVHSFQKQEVTERSKGFVPVGTRQILNELLSFKGYKGEFVKRRVKSFVKNNPEWQNGDDVSVAAIYLR